MPTPAWKKRNIFEDVLHHEDALTDALRNFLKYSAVQEALWRTLPKCVREKVCFPSIEDIQTRFSGGYSGGLPDLIICGPDFVLVIEVKIGAELTPAQKKAYIPWIKKAVRDSSNQKGFVVFLIPDDYPHKGPLDTYIKSARKRCRSENIDIQVDSITWQNLLTELKAQDLASLNETIREFFSHLSERFESVEFSREEIQMIQSVETASGIYKLMDIVEKIKNRIKNDKSLQIQLHNKLEPYSYGYEFEVVSRGKKKSVWFGVWPDYWSKYKNAPLCICMYTNPKHNPQSIIDAFERRYGDDLKKFEDGDEQCLVVGFKLREPASELIETVVEDIKNLLR